MRPADLTAGLGGNWGVPCPECDSWDSLGEIVGCVDGAILQLKMFVNFPYYTEIYHKKFTLFRTKINNLIAHCKCHCLYKFSVYDFFDYSSGY